MARGAVLALRVVIVIAMAGSVLVQAMMVAAFWFDDDAGELPVGVRATLAVIAVLGIGCLQVIGVCVWRLLALVGAEAVFSEVAFRFVDGIMIAVAFGSGLIFAIAVVARFANHATPGDEVPPGVVAIICGLALVVAGVALVVYVLRVLLAKAVAMRSELDVVI